MSTHFSPQLDPAVVLGVARDASLEEIRNAYRAKAKLYHPDKGGEDWVFKILAQAYETMSIARVVRASERDGHSAPRRAPVPPHHPTASAPPPPPPPPQGGKPRARQDPTETVRPGIQEPAVHPTQVVDVEKLSVRYEADHVWLISEHGADQRLLSCCLNLTWPASIAEASMSPSPANTVIINALGAAFEEVSTRCKPVAARSAVLDGRFSGWLSFPNNERAAAALAQILDQVHAAGLVVKQWSRDIIIPRDWK